MSGRERDRAIAIIRSEMSGGLSDETQRVLTRCINLISNEISDAPEDMVLRSDVLNLFDQCEMPADDHAKRVIGNLRKAVKSLPNG